MIRKVKRWINLHFGARKVAREREEEQKRAEIEAERVKREHVFGIKRENNEGKWWKIWRKGNK